MFTEAQFKRLTSSHDSNLPCVSIYIPTYRSGNNQEDMLRFKNALSEATEQLTTYDALLTEPMSKHKAQEYLAGAYQLLEDPDFWLDLSDGLALFVHNDTINYYKVNIDFSSFVYVNDHFYLRHLMPLLSAENRFFILALSQNEVRFFEANAHSITPVIIEDLVPLEKDAVVISEDKEAHLQMHSAGSSGGVFHGQGGGKDDDDETLKKYFRQIDEGLMKMLHDENAPMIIYSVDHQVALYKELSNYTNLVEEHVSGNPENDDPVLIHEKAWSKLKSAFAFDAEQAKSRFLEKMTDEKALHDLKAIFWAAFQGRVEELFVDSKAAPVWGSYKLNTNEVQMAEAGETSDACLLNFITKTAHENGARINAINAADMPVPTAPVNAILRF